MESRAKALGHPILQMLVVFPLGLLGTAVIFDILYLITDRDGFSISAGYMIAAGLIGGLVAAVPGLVDWLAIPAGTRAKRIGATHGIGNVVVLVLFFLSWLMRTGDDWNPGVLGFLLGVIGLGVAGFTGWLGGELVDRLGVGVHDNAGLDAPSSLGRDVPGGARGTTSPA